MQCFNLVPRASAIPARDLLQLFEGVLFNYVVGNHDAHGKNFSLLYPAAGDQPSVCLAPFYDLISTAICPALSSKLAMKIGKSYESAQLRLRDWEAYWEAIGFSNKQAGKQTVQFAETLIGHCGSPETEVQEKIQKVILGRAGSLKKLLA